MAERSKNDFDHTQYEDEVIERWGKAAYELGDRWWRSLSEEEKRQFQQEQLDIAREYAKAKSAGEPADGEVAQAITRRQYRWISTAWGHQPSREAFQGTGRMYVDDPRFTAHYDSNGAGTAEYVRDAMMAYADRHLE